MFPACRLQAHGQFTESFSHAFLIATQLLGKVGPGCELLPSRPHAYGLHTANGMGNANPPPHDPSASLRLVQVQAVSWPAKCWAVPTGLPPSADNFVLTPYFHLFPSLSFCFYLFLDLTPLSLSPPSFLLSQLFFFSRFNMFP